MDKLAVTSALSGKRYLFTRLLSVSVLIAASVFQVACQGVFMNDTDMIMMLSRRARCYLNKHESYPLESELLYFGNSL